MLARPASPLSLPQVLSAFPDLKARITRLAEQRLADLKASAADEDSPAPGAPSLTSGAGGILSPLRWQMSDSDPK